MKRPTMILSRWRLTSPQMWAMALAVCSMSAVAQTTAPETQPETKPETTAEKEEPLVYVKMTTSKGDIILELNQEKAPITVKNFLSYTDKDFFSGTIFHRIMSTFMIQGGGFTEDMKQKPTDAPIKLESMNGLKNKRGTIAMARTGVPDSATSQFFINVVDNAMLDAQAPNTGYAVFGKVVAGMDTVDAIRDVPTVPNPMMRGEDSKPTETVTIDKVTRLTKDEANKLMEAEKSPATQAE